MSALEEATRDLLVLTKHFSQWDWDAKNMGKMKSNIRHIKAACS